MRRHSRGFPGLPCLIVALLLGALVSRDVRAEENLTDFDFLLLGLGVRPEPEVQTVPRNTASGLFVRIELSSSIPLSVEPDLLLSLLPPGLEVRGELVGPGLEPGIQLQAAPGELLPIPPLATRGLYVVRDIRLVLDGEPYLRASPDVATVEVIDRVLVTQVTTRPLTLEEIRQKGILFGDDSFTGYNFQLALRLDSRPVTIDLPVVFDSHGVPVPLRSTGSIDISGPGLPALSAGLTPVLMKPDLPRLDPEILAEIPPDLQIPGLLVIPGDVGFLNQFFSALLIVSNGAPAGSLLTVHSLEGKIGLPPGEDGLGDTSDDPLRLAVTEGGPPADMNIAAILGPGGDRFAPGEQGQAEYLLEGRREGFHEIGFDIAGSLDGLPVGTIPIRGEARGGVLVRNRDFHLTFSVPATVRAQEEFTLYVTVTNTALDNAPLVRVGIGGAVSGASLIPGETDVRTIEDLAPRESETLPFRFASTQTGQVTASYLRVEQGTGKLLFHLGVGERGVPLSSDTLVLPSTVEALASPAEKSTRRSPRVVQAALRVLGAGWSIATAPAGSVPEDVTPVSRQTVLDRATAIGEAGFRVQLGESLERALLALAMDFLSDSDPGFFEIVHQTDAGRDFLEAIGATLREIPSLPADVFSLNLELAEDLSSRAKHLLVGVGGTAPPRVEVFGPTRGGFVPLEGGSGLVLVPTIEGSLYEVRFQSTVTGSFDLALNVPFVGGGTGVYVFEDVPVDAGSSGSVVLDLRRSPDRLRLEAVESQSVRFFAPRGPKLLAATAIGPETLNGADPWGRLVALLFDREVRAAEAEAASSYEVEANAILSARRQLSGRLVFLFLRDPVGNFIPREAEVEGLFDPTGKPMSPFLQRDVIASRLTDPGAIVSGRVLDASGNPVPTAEVLYLNGGGIGLSQKSVAPDGSYGFDYVRQSDRGGFAIRATDLASGAIQELSTRVTEDGEHIEVDLVLRGRGGVEGFVRNLLGEPRPGARVLATSQADPTSFAFAEANGDGFYRATGIVVGPVSVKAVDGTFSGVASGNVYRAGAFARVDVVLNESRGRVQGRVFEFFEGVATAPLPDVDVYYVLEGASDIVASSTRSGPTGGYAFEGMPTGRFRILALDRVTGRQATSPFQTLSAEGDLTIDVFFEREKVGTIRGTVAGGTGPLSGVLVQAAGRLVVTSPEFVLTNVPVGTHSVSASDPLTHRGASATVVVVEGEVTNVSLRLSGAGQVVVRVVDPQGASIAGQQVIRVSGLVPCGGEALVTGLDGTATFEGVTVPGARFRASRDGDIAIGTAVLAREGESVLLTLRFGGFGVVFGEVRDESGPVFGADVFLGSLRYDSTICENVPDGKARQIRTDSLGRYRFEKVLLGSVSVTASAGTGTSLPATAKDAILFDGDARELNLTLTDNLGGRLTGTVFLPDGTTPAGAGVRVSTTSPIGAEVAVVTKDDGSYELPKILAPGRYELKAHDPVSGRVARETVYLLAEQDFVADLRLLGLGAVVVTVRNGSGIPVDEAFVELEGTGFPFDERAGAILPTDGGRIRFDRVTEGSFTVSAASEGKGGRSTGSVSEEGSVANVTVQLTSVGRIVGVLKSPDGTAGVPNAEILVKQGATGRLVGSTTTSSVPETVPLECRALFGNEVLGFFTLFSVPAGSFLATATDPLTGRIGEASARIEADGEAACVEIRLLGLGTLAGTVVAGPETMPGAKVELTSSTGLSSVANLRAEATTDGAGAFRFEGVPVGSFTLRATVAGLLLTGTASGTIKEDGETLEDIEVALEESGSLEGAVTFADGTTPVAGALMTLKPRTGILRTESTADGSFAFEFVPAGDFTLTAEENGGFDGGILEGTLLPNEHLEGLVLKFRGTGTIEGAALDSDGFELASGLVRLTTPPPFARSETATVDGSGSFRFLEVPVGAFDLVLEVAGSPLRGIASGEIANDGDVVAVSIELQAARPVVGRVVREDATTPAPNVSVTLKSAGFPFQDLTDEAGGFRFSGVPLGAFTLRAEDALTGGIALASGALDDATPDSGLDLGTLILDTTPIEVSAVAPADGATLVPPDSAVQLTFSDPIGTSSLVGLVTVSSSGAGVSGSLEILDDGLTGRFTPTPFLPPRALVTVVVSGSVNDVFGRTLGEEFRASFTTGGAVVTGIVRNQSLVVSGAEVQLSSGGSSAATTTDDAGRYRFENVDVGTASILATSGPLSGSRVIEIAPAAGVVSADIPLSLVGSVTGTVTEWDGSPSPAGLTVIGSQSGVAVGIGETTFDGVATRYRIDNVPLGSVVIDVENEANGDLGQASGTLIEAGAAIDLPVRMLGVGAVRVLVTDALGAAVDGAAVSLSYSRFGKTTPRAGTTDSLGEVLFPNVLAGLVSVFAESSGRSASGSIEAKPADTVTIPLTVHTLSGLEGRVVTSPGPTPFPGAPFPGAKVLLYRDSGGLLLGERTTDGSGEFSFTEVPALVAAYRVDVSVNGRLRARARNVTVPEAAPGFVELELVPVGVVAGDLTAPAALSSSVTVTLQSFAPDFGGTFTTTQIVGNRYSIEGVPPGPFHVTARDSLKGFIGESSGVMPPEVGNVEIDVALAANTFPIPIGGYRLTDGNDASYRILRSGGSTEGAGQVFSATTPGGMLLDLTVGPTTASYSGSELGFVEEGGRELVTARQSLLGVGVQRKVYVPADGYFARYLEVLENETDQPLAITATLTSNFNNGSGASSLVDESDVEGQWLVLDDLSDADPFIATGTIPAVAFVLSGNAVAPVVAPLENGAGANERRLSVSYDLTLPPGAKVVLLHFAVQQLSRAAAKTAALRLSALAPEALVGLEADESSRVLNFDVPADGSSLVPPLPARNGRVSGRLFTNDGTTLVEISSGSGSLEVQLQSDHILFRRVQSVFTTTGSFAFDPPALPLPRAGFTLRGTRTFGAFSTSALAPRDFIGEALVSRAPDVTLTAGSFISGRPPSSAVDGLVGTFWEPSGPERWLRFAIPSPVRVREIVVRRHSSAVLTGVTLTLSGASSLVETFPFGAEAELRIPLDVSGVDTIRLDFQGTTIRVDEVQIRGVASQDIGYAVQDLVFSESASIDVSIRNADGDLVSSFVQPLIGTFNLSDIAAPAGKVFLAPIPPQAPVVLNARGNVGHRFQRASVAAPPLSAGVVTPVEIVLPVGAHVSGQATNNAGAGIPSHTVNLFVVSGPGAGEGGTSTTTDPSGGFAFEQVPSGSYRLSSTFGGLTLNIPFTVSAPAPVIQNLQFLTPGSVDLQVRFESADGSLIVVNGAKAELVDSQNQVQTRTTSNGLASFATVAAGPFVLRITHPTNTASITVSNGTLSPGQTLQLTVAIPSFGTVDGDVFFANSSPATGGLVELLEPGLTRSQTTTAAGFHFTTVRAAVELTLRARHPQSGRTHIFKEEKVTLPREGAILDVPITLPATGTVVVTVKRQNTTAGIPGVEIFIRDSFSGSFRAEGSTDANGDKVITVVPKGAFTVRAERGGELLGETGGTLALHGESVNVEIVAAGDASVGGVVFGGDGETPVPEVTVEIRSADGAVALTETMSSSDGAYQFDDAVEPGTSVLVRAFLPFSPEKLDERVVTANASGDPIVFDPVLPISVIKGRVLEPDGTTPVVGATVESTPYGVLFGFTATTGESGEFVLFDADLGVHSLVAEDVFGLASFATGVVASVDQALVKDLVLPEFGSVEVSVVDENAVARTEQPVMLRSGSLLSPRTASADVNGIYRFERVALGAFTVTYDEPDFFTRRSGSTVSRLTEVERNAPVSIVLPGFTTIFGELVEGGLPATPLDEFTPLALEGRLQESSTGIYRKDDGLDIEGDYRVENVPEGAITLTAIETLVPPPIVSSETAIVTADEIENQVDIERGTAAGFDVELGPGLAVTNDGTLFAQGTALARAVVNGKEYPPLAAASPDPADPNHFVLGPIRTSGVDYRRDVYRPSGESFVRYLEIFENPHDFDVEVTLRLESGLFVFATSSGDDRIDPTDRYFTSFGSGTVIGGASRPPDFAGSDFDTSFDLAWRNLVVPANGRLVLMHFGIGADDDVEALALAQSLTDLSHPKALFGLDPILRPSIVNFEIP